VLNLERSLEFYKKALGLVEVRRKEGPDGSFTLVFLGDEKNPTQPGAYLAERPYRAL
jgi:lactoylglutathione lyase